MAAVRAAEFTQGTKVRPSVLEITLIDNGSRTYLERHVVLGKAEARKLAAKLDAIPWNF